MKRISIILTAALLASCGAPLSEQMVRSEMQRHPAADLLDNQDGTPKWNYTTGLELKAILDASPKALDYVDAWYDTIIDSTGVKIGRAHV